MSPPPEHGNVRAGIAVCANAAGLRMGHGAGLSHLGMLPGHIPASASPFSPGTERGIGAPLEPPSRGSDCC